MNSSPAPPASGKSAEVHDHKPSPNGNHCTQSRMVLSVPASRAASFCPAAISHTMKNSPFDFPMPMTIRCFECGKVFDVVLTSEDPHDFPCPACGKVEVFDLGA